MSKRCRLAWRAWKHMITWVVLANSMDTPIKYPDWLQRRIDECE